jgi:tRNA A-37 threonylcarbamoyl transferase component Bud32/membrane-associated phospholipid phosphatase
MSTVQTPTSRISPERKRRRPSGEPPPLPRPLRSTGRLMLGLLALVVLAWVTIVLVANAGETITRLDLAVLRFLERYRSSAFTAVARTIDDLFVSEISIRILRWATILMLLAFKRFRHLVVYLVSVLAVGLITTQAAMAVTRPRPFGIEILDHWQGSSHPSRPMAALAVTLLGILYTAFVAGRPRKYGKWAAGAIILAAVGARLYLAVEHPTDILFGVILGVTVPLIAFRMLTPNDVFPVTYGRGRTAHLDIGGERGDAIKRALEEQLGVTVLEMKPFGLEGSGGSTPIRLKVVEGETHNYLFAKLYAQNHLRADRWYKIGRTLLYGRLEDETAFSTVRRLVQYEDYLLRVMKESGINVPTPYGFVEITPQREYLLVTDFVYGATEIHKADVTDDTIDQAMKLVRRLWDAGIAHRDIKPSNLLVKDGDLHLIDVAFGEVRPSPWRQAVDLANMMVVLALTTEPERVYDIALRHFTPEEISEAFAATHSVTMPSQSRSMMRKDQRNLVARFRELGPPHKPIAIQRWSARRVALLLSCLMGAFIFVQLLLGNLPGAGLISPPQATHADLSSLTRAPECREILDPVLLVAQSVKGASQIPCLRAMPVGWTFRAVDVEDTSSRFYLDYDRPGVHELTAIFKASCDTSGSSPVPSGPTDSPSAERYERVLRIEDQYVGTRYYVFNGGCLQLDFEFHGSGRTALADQAAGTFGFLPRSNLDAVIKSHGVSP